MTLLMLSVMLISVPMVILSAQSVSDIWSVATVRLGLWTGIRHIRLSGLNKKWLVDFNAGKTFFQAFSAKIAVFQNSQSVRPF